MNVLFLTNYWVSPHNHIYFSSSHFFGGVLWVFVDFFSVSWGKSSSVNSYVTLISLLHSIIYGDRRVICRHSQSSVRSNAFPLITIFFIDFRGNNGKKMTTRQYRRATECWRSFFAATFLIVLWETKLNADFNCGKCSNMRFKIRHLYNSAITSTAHWIISSKLY